MNWALIKNSLSVAGLVTLLSVAVGFAAALWLAALEERWRLRWLAVSVIAMTLPPFLVANCWLDYLGYNGKWHSWLSWDIYSLGGAVWILTLLLWPITMLAALGAWRRLERSQLESDMAVTGAAFMRCLLLPLAGPTLAQAAVLTFVLALNNFAVPALLQVKVFPAEVWLRFNASFDTWGALWISWPMILVPLCLLVWFRRAQLAWPQLEPPVPARLFRRQLGRTWFAGCGALTIAACVIAVGLPLFQLLSSGRTWRELLPAYAAAHGPVWNSILFATLGASVCIAAGLAGWRWRIGLALWLPFLVPGVVLGIGLIAVFNRPWLSAFYQSAGIVVAAFGIRYLAPGWNGVAHAMRSLDRDQTDAARLDGASRWQMLRHIQWPQISSQVAAAWYVIFLLCLWDVESMVLIVPPGRETLALRIFNLLHYGHNAQVNALCLTLLAVALAPLVVWRLCALISQRTRPGPAIPALALVCAAAALAGCSGGNPREKKIDSKFFSRVEVIGSRGVGVGEFDKPRSLTVDHEDNVYVADVTGRIQKFSPDAQLLLSWQMRQTNGEGPKGMCCDRQGRIVVLEPHFQRVNVYSTNGTMLDQWGKTGTNRGQLSMPCAVAINSHGDYIIPEYMLVDRIQVFSEGGKNLLNVIGKPGTGNGELDRAESVCVDSADRIYAADSCNHRIQVFSPDGKWLRSYGKAGSGPGEFSYPYDICIDREGRQYVCEFGNSRIQIFDKDDHLLEVLGSPGSEPGQFSDPWSIALDSKGNLYVADSLNNRVQKFLRR